MSLSWNSIKRGTRKMYSLARGIPTNHKTQVSRELIAESKYGHMPTIRRILNDPVVNITMKNTGGKTALLNAARDGHLELVRTLLADPRMMLDTINMKDIRGNTALMKAARNGHSDIVKLLLAKGANPNSVAMDGTSALIYATEHKHISCIKQLLQAGADVNQMRTIQRINALMLSLMVPRFGFLRLYTSTDREITELLVNTPGINLNAQTRSGETALTFAILNMKDEFVERLLSKVSNIDITIGNIKESLDILSNKIDSIYKNYPRQDNRELLSRYNKISRAIFEYKTVINAHAPIGTIVSDRYNKIHKAELNITRKEYLELMRQEREAKKAQEQAESEAAAKVQRNREASAKAQRNREASAKAKAEADARAKAEAARAKAKAEADARAKAEADARAKVEAARAKAEAARAKAEADARARAKAEADARAKAEADARAKAEAARAKAEAEAKTSHNREAKRAQSNQTIRKNTIESCTKLLKDIGIYSEKSTKPERYTETHKQWRQWTKIGHPDKAIQLGKNREDMHNFYIRVQACKDKVYNKLLF